jgi:predicted transposase/invertase (TIGR01784 family)
MPGIEFVLIELPNFIPANHTELKITALWLRFLKEIKDGTIMISQELMDVPEIAEAIEVLKVTSYTKAELDKYDKYWDILRTQQTFINDALKKGRLEGKLEGKLEGNVEGEEKTNQKTAQKLILRGFSNEDIADITGLDIHEINRIREEMN